MAWLLFVLLELGGWRVVLEMVKGVCLTLKHDLLLGLHFE